MDERSERLLRLERIIAESGAADALRNDIDPADTHLRSVPLERIRRLTAVLEERAGCPVDAIDAVTMRLLLHDYTTAVAHLRSVARTTEQRLMSAAAPVQDGKRLLRQVTRAAERIESRRQG